MQKKTKIDFFLKIPMIKEIIKYGKKFLLKNMKNTAYQKFLIVFFCRWYKCVSNGYAAKRKPVIIPYFPYILMFKQKY